ncbi:hypothetical protein SLA2020_135880 [Shorea laevis]
MRVALVLICAALCVPLFVGSAFTVPKDPFYGISPQDESYYKTSSDTIKCKDGSKKFKKSQLNDDYCDCPDGTDEPGTSACPAGKFYCQNAGHIPRSIFSSRVNDGICDCCDGSDEYDGNVKCKNTCWEAGKATRDNLKKKIATYQEGVTLRKQEIEQARIAIAKDEAELTKLKNEEKILKPLVQQLKERKEQIEKAEEKERLQKEKEEEKKREAEEALSKESEPREAEVETDEAEQTAGSGDNPTESTHDDIIGTVDNDPLDEDLEHENQAAKVENSDTTNSERSPLNGVEQHAVENKEESASAIHKDDSAVAPETGGDDGSGVVPDDVKKTGNELSENTEELSREELGRLVASRWTGENAEKHANAKDNSHEDEGHDETLKQTHDEEHDGYAPDTDDDTGKYDDTDDDMDEAYEDDNHDDPSLSYKSDDDNHDDPSSSYKSDDDIDLSDTSTTTPSNPSWLEKIRQTVRNVLQAVNLFQTPVNISDAAYVRKEYDESSAKLSKIQSSISSLTKKLKQDFGPEKEFYSFYGRCFEMKQNKYVYKVCPYKQASQEEGYSKTRLGEWEKFEDSYRVLLFSIGDKCWNGPDRSLKVKLRCGLKNEIIDVDEPSRCEYVALLSTPVFCTEDRLKELQNKLDLLNKEQPQKHDEL